MNQTVIDEIQLRQYKDKAGVYFIQCYDGVIKIGQSNDVYSRLTSYQGVYWQNRILKVWTCNSPLFLEQQLHMVLGVELKQIRKGKYEIFKINETEQQDLNKIIELVDTRAQQIMKMMEAAIDTNLDAEVSRQINNTYNESNDDKSTEGAPSTIMTNSDSMCTETRVQCRFSGCIKRTTKGYCFKHHPDNASYNAEKHREHKERQKNTIEGYLKQIDELNVKVKTLEAENWQLKIEIEGRHTMNSQGYFIRDDTVMSK